MAAPAEFVDVELIFTRLMSMREALVGQNNKKYQFVTTFVEVMKRSYALPVEAEVRQEIVRATSQLEELVELDVLAHLIFRFIEPHYDIVDDPTFQEERRLYAGILAQVEDIFKHPLTMKTDEEIRRMKGLSVHRLNQSAQTKMAAWKEKMDVALDEIHNLMVEREYIPRTEEKFNLASLRTLAMDIARILKEMLDNEEDVLAVYVWNWWGSTLVMHQNVLFQVGLLQ